MQFVELYENDYIEGESCRLGLLHTKWFTRIAEKYPKLIRNRKRTNGFLLDITHPILGQKSDFEEWTANFDLEKFESKKKHFRNW